ncbi:MAG: hypothetical protein U0T81_07740 [Saprospiraceae bacterium]
MFKITDEVGIKAKIQKIENAIRSVQSSSLLNSRIRANLRIEL